MGAGERRLPRLFRREDLPCPPQRLDERGIQHIYLDYFGTQFSIEHLRIPNTRVNADQAKQIRQGCLVVSTSELMRPEWAWLRASRQPTARVAHTLFVYQI